MGFAVLRAVRERDFKGPARLDPVPLVVGRQRKQVVGSRVFGGQAASNVGIVLGQVGTLTGLQPQAGSLEAGQPPGGHVANQRIDAAQGRGVVTSPFSLQGITQTGAPVS